MASLETGEAFDGTHILRRKDGKVEAAEADADGVRIGEFEEVTDEETLEECEEVLTAEGL